MKSVQYSGSALWNCLPLMLKEQMSTKSFKNKVKLHLLSEMVAAWLRQQQHAVNSSQQ